MREITVGEKLKKERKLLKWKLVYVAERLGQTPEGISYIEKRNDDGVFIRYLKLLREAGVDLNTLFE